MKKLIAIIFGVSLVLLAQNAFATVLLSDSFNTEHGGVGILNYTGFTNWNVIDMLSNGRTATVDLIGNGYFDFYPGNGLFVDLDGSTADAGKLESKTDFTLNPGVYELKFWLGGSTRGDTNTVTAALGSVYSETFNYLSSNPFNEVTRYITVPISTSGKLSFYNSVGGGDNMGLILDDVKLSAIPGAVPEPATLLLLGLGLLGMVRKKKA